MKRDNKLVKVSTLTLIVSHNVNFRDDYDLPSMIAQIKQAGRVLEPITVEKDSGIVLKGNRRTAACQAILEDPNASSELKKAVENMDVVYVSDLSDQERTALVLDHGSQKPLSRVETIKAVWRLMRETYTEAEISNTMYQLLARFTGNTRKAMEAEQIPPGDAREEFIKKWLHGTVGNIIMAVGRMGETVREQYLLSELSKDRKLTEDEQKRVLFSLDNARIQELTKAKKADGNDKEGGKGWTCESGGELFNSVIAKFKDEDAKPKGPKTKRFTPEQMVATAESMQSGLKLAFLKCADKLADGDRSKLDALDTELFRRDKVFSVLTAHRERVLNADVQKLIGAILYDSPDQVLVAVNRFLGSESQVA